MFNNYKSGTELVKNSINKKQFIFENKKLIKYGEKILNLTYQEIVKIV